MIDARVDNYPKPKGFLVERLCRRLFSTLRGKCIEKFTSLDARRSTKEPFSVMDDIEIKVAKSSDFTMFVPAFIDEYGFSAAQFRIFARIMRRSLGEKSEGCYETIQRLSLNLGISKRIVQESLKILRQAKCIRVIKREGTSNLITFQPCDKWVSKMEFDAIVLEVTGKRIQRDKERKMGGSAETLPSAETHHPLVRKRTTKVLPLKDIPKNTLAIAQDDSEDSTQDTDHVIDSSSFPKENGGSAPSPDHARLMKHHADRVGRITDGAKQGALVKQLLKQFTADECIECYDFQVSEDWRKNQVSWATVIDGTRGISTFVATPKEPVHSYNYVKGQPTQREAIEAEQKMIAEMERESRQSNGQSS